MQFAYIAIMCCLYPLALLIYKSVGNSGEQITVPGLTLDGFVSILGIAIIGFAIADLIFFPIYYKNGKSIVMSTLFTILGFVFYPGMKGIAIVNMPR